MATLVREEVHARVQEHIIQPVLADFQNYIDGDITFHINPTGRFVIGGPAGDTGLTGRKIIVDTYGGMCPHGGGAFSGKDPTKVDRSAAYMARHIAKCIVAADLADRCVVGLAYAIGVAQPVSVNVETFGVPKRSTTRQSSSACEITLICRQTALSSTWICATTSTTDPRKMGHFGNPDFAWERIAEANGLK